jgi:hypothetical protein
MAATMIRFLLCLGAGLLAGIPASAEDASWLTQPADPRLGTRAPRYTSVTAGVRRFGVVEPKNWRELNQAVGPKPGGMSGMGGGSMPGMNMGGMDHGAMPGMKMPAKRSK